MGNRLAAAMLVGLTVGATPAARADDPPAEAGAGPARTDHHGQFGLALALATGSRFIKTWDSGGWCGERASAGNGGGNATYCTARAPAALDVSLSYGVSRGVDLLLDIRFGLERDFGPDPAAEGPRLRHYAPGARFWLTRGTVRFFATAQLALDTTGYRDAAGADLPVDVRLRNANGLQVDFHDAYGVYAYFGEQLAFRRWVEGELELGAGVQARYP